MTQEKSKEKIVNGIIIVALFVGLISVMTYLSLTPKVGFYNWKTGEKIRNT